LIGRFFEEIRRSNGAILVQNIHFIVYIVCLVAYTLSPVDLIPEFVFGIFGFIDDIIVVLYIFVAISSVFYQYLV
jgi:RING finger protein 170